MEIADDDVRLMRELKRIPKGIRQLNFLFDLIVILLLISIFLNIASFFITFSIFSFLFNVIGDIPGIGVNVNRAGSAIYLSGISAVFLINSANNYSHNIV